MTKTSIIAIALFSSACATDASDYEDARANAEDELEEIIRNLNGDDDDESSSDKMGPNDVSESPTETVDTTVLEKAMNDTEWILNQLPLTPIIFGLGSSALWEIENLDQVV